jgi:Cu(I)/Ag(I) efflux system membrane fusion protein
MTEKPDAMRLPQMSRKMQAFSMVLFFLLGAAMTAFLVGDPLGLFGESSSDSSDGHNHEEATVKEEAVPHMCPMHPEVIESGPGSCPICKMDLIAVRKPKVETEPGASEEAGVITIDPTQIQNTGVVSVPAVVEDIARASRTVGILDYDADLIEWVNTKFDGWIEKVHVNYVGQEVRKGQPLFEIYSPDLVTTQEEYLRALEYVDSMQGSGRKETRLQAEALLRSARERMEFWDISPEQIDKLESSRTVQRRLTVHSPADGVVAEVMNDSLEGMRVRSGMNLYKIADLSTIWVHADIYEADLPWVEEGLPAVVTFRNDPGKVYQGKVLFLYPEVNKKTRTLKVCVAVSNEKRQMRPGMYADVTVQGPVVKNAVIVPRSAVLRSGERDLVFLALGDGRFQPREVRLGVAGKGDRIQIVAGIEPGQQVVVQSQFMLDSESRIQEAIAKFMTRTTAEGNSDD